MSKHIPKSSFVLQATHLDTTIVITPQQTTKENLTEI